MSVDQFVMEKLRARLASVPERDKQLIHDEENLAVELGVQIKTVRKALAALESEGLVRLSERGETGFSVAETRELFEAREVIEGMAARLVVRHGLEQRDADELYKIASKLDEYFIGEEQYLCERAFHKRVVELSGNSLLLRMYSMVEQVLCDYFSSRTSGSRPDEMPEELKQLHAGLVDTLLENSEENAERAFRQHCTKVIRFITAGGHV